MDYVGNVFSLPDEVLVALNHFLNSCEEESPAQSYPFSDEDTDKPISRSKDPQSPMQRQTKSFEEETDSRCSNNGRPNRPPADQEKLAPSCSKSKDFSGYYSTKCPNNPTYYQEELTVYPFQDQKLRQQLKRPCQLQAALNRSLPCQRRFSRSQSVPRGNFNERYSGLERFDCPKGLLAGQESINPPRGCCAGRNSNDFQGQETRNAARGCCAGRNSDDFQGQGTRTPPRGRLGARNSCEGDVPNRNTRNYVPHRNSRCNAAENWNNSSQVGTNYGEWQRRQQQQLHRQRKCPCCHQQINDNNMTSVEDDEISGFEPDLNSTMQKYTQPPIRGQDECTNNQTSDQKRQQQHRHRQRQSPCRQQQFNESSADDDEISGFEPDLNSTMIDEEKRQKSTKNYSQSTMRGQRSCCNNKTSGQQSYESPPMPRRAAQRDSSQMQRRNTPCESPPMQRRKPQPQPYETVINETSYLGLPERIREAPCRSSIDRNQFPNSQAMYQDNSPNNPRNQRQNNHNCQSNYQSANSSDREMENTGMCPEDTNRTRSPTYMTMSRSMMARSRLNQSNLEKKPSCGGRHKKMQPKTPEDFLAERTYDEFMEALVKDRSCPGAIQSSLNGNDNFNEFAFDIAFAGSIPGKPTPVDPITMLEAVKLRIDYEREEIRKNHRHVTMEAIESHFKEVNKTEVNEGVAAFLKAEVESQSDKQPDSFDAEINSLETHLVDESIKMNVYTARTQPGQEVKE